MPGLYKKEVLIREVSTISVQAAKDWTINWITNEFQEAESNKSTQYDEDGNPIYVDSYGYIDYFFADIFDSRDGNIYRVYSESCRPKYSMTNIEYSILDNAILAKKAEIPKIINDEITLNGDTVELTHLPYEGVLIGDEARIVIADNAIQTTYLSIDYTISGKTVTVAGDVAGEFSGHKLKVSYLYVV